jgi:hypothetical protein
MAPFRTGILNATFTVYPDPSCFIRNANMKGRSVLGIGDSDKQCAVIVAVALNHLKSSVNTGTLPRGFSWSELLSNALPVL